MRALALAIALVAITEQYAAAEEADDAPTLTALREEGDAIWRAAGGGTRAREVRAELEQVPIDDAGDAAEWSLLCVFQAGRRAWRSR